MVENENITANQEVGQVSEANEVVNTVPSVQELEEPVDPAETAAGTAAVVETPNPIVEQQIALDVKPEEVFEGGPTTKYDEITEMVSNVVNSESAAPVEEVPEPLESPAETLEAVAQESLPEETVVTEEVVAEPVVEQQVEAPAEEVAIAEPAVLEPVVEEVPVETPVVETAEVVNAAPVEEPAPVAETPASVEEPAPVEEVKAEEVALPPVEEAPIEGSLLPKPEEVAPTAEEVIEQETGGDLIDRSLQGIVVETPENEVDEADNEDVDLDESVEDSSLDGLFLDHEEFNDNDERFAHSMVHTDRIEDVDVDDFDTKYRTPVVIDDEDTIMTDVAKSMGALIKQNRELKTTLTTTEEKLGKVLASRRNLADRSTMLEKKIEVLTSKLRSLDTTLSKLESKYQSLEAKNLDQERIIESQAHELEVIRPQLQGKEDLVQLLADAQVILGTDDEYSYKRKAA